MNGSPEFPERRNAPSDSGPARPHRHRHVPRAGTWTPVVPDGPQQVGQPSSPRHRSPIEFPPARGTLPVSSQEDAGYGAPMRRTAVTFTSPPPQPKAEQPDEAYEHSAPPDGLGKFDLGSVPASVTPPRTWRKAAWFAVLSSGGVVVALLVAGSVLVSQPPVHRHALDSWPDRHGGAPLLPSEEYADTAEPTSAAPSSSPPSFPETTADDRTAALRTPAPTTEAGEMAPATSTMPATTTTSRELQKPPVTPASTSTVGYTLLWNAYDAETMAEHSQDYFNTITEDPEVTYALTTGELAADGPEGLRQKYADIAYFEVQHVHIDNNQGRTTNTVEVTYKDGTKAEQTHTLVFNRKEKIVEDTAESEDAEDGTADTEDTTDPAGTADAGDTE